MVSCKFYETFKNIFFRKHLRMTVFGMILTVSEFLKFSRKTPVSECFFSNAINFNSTALPNKVRTVCKIFRTILFQVTFCKFF